VSYLEEFRTVDLVLNSGAGTRGVDAFALALIKSERQMRRLVTHLVFQSPALTVRDIPRLIKTLASSRRVYFDGVVAGFDAVSPAPVVQLVGPEHDRLRQRLKELGRYRNKIFHGQLSGEGLGTDELLAGIDDIKLWCRLLGESSTREFGYDGFGDSFLKSPMPGLPDRLRTRIESVEQYAAFIAEHMERPEQCSGPGACIARPATTDRGR
jgi:hypothetical protein